MRRKSVFGRRRLGPFVVICAAITNLISPVGGQEPQVRIEPRVATGQSAKSEADRAETRIQVNSTLVLIPVMVTDGRDHLIIGLARDQFRLWDEKAEQVISHFAAEDAPVSIGVVFDSSGSMRNKINESRAAVAEFVRGANPDDEFSLVEFNDRPHLVGGFTSQPQELQQELMSIEPQGRTALLDGIMLSLDQMQHAKHRRKAILIISDGGDNNSRYTSRDVKARLRESDVQVYSIGILELPFRRRTMEELGGAALLDEVARETGGRLYEVDDLSDLAGIASTIGEALRSQYVLGFAPTAEMRDGKYHRVRVKVARTKGHAALRASFRSGYYAPSN